MSEETTYAIGYCIEGGAGLPTDVRLSWDVFLLKRELIARRLGEPLTSQNGFAVYYTYFGWCVDLDMKVDSKIKAKEVRGSLITVTQASEMQNEKDERILEKLEKLCSSVDLPFERKYVRKW